MDKNLVLALVSLILLFGCSQTGGKWGTAPGGNPLDKENGNISAVNVSQVPSSANVCEEDVTSVTVAPDNTAIIEYDVLNEAVIPESGLRMNVTWGDFAPVLVEEGIVNISKLNRSLALRQNGLSDKQLSVLVNGSDERIVISENNSQFILDLFWALGLSNRNPILYNGTISRDRSMVPRYASTYFWTLGDNEGPQYFSGRRIINLTEDQSRMVLEIMDNVYRPCCDNPASFPDCNHGMAALGLAELMVYQNASEEEVYSALLAANSYWFPQAYLEMAAYFESSGTGWGEVDPELALSKNYSSFSGYQRFRSELDRLPEGYIGGSSCG